MDLAEPYVELSYMDAAHESRRRPLLDCVTARFEDVALLTPDELGRLSPVERSLHDEDRLDHHARMLVVATSFVEKTVACGRRLVLLNRHAISARRSLMDSRPHGAEGLAPHQSRQCPCLRHSPPTGAQPLKAEP
ncbi:hypothetical protein [Streptomyces sp. NPDC048496]|uniref:hypothetical protein n=1 Tax=Streptomyces sp. NPDC048496 TaxID=3365558 RepID=UPI00371B629D